MLNNIIKMNAWTVWLLLSRNGKMPVSKINKYIGEKDMFIYLTLNWLAKINIISLTNENGALYADLKSHIKERDEKSIKKQLEAIIQ